MNNISKHFKELYKGLSSGDERYSIMGRDHVSDRELGIDYHLYDDTFKITEDDEVVFTHKDASSDESACLMQVKRMLDKAYMQKNRATLGGIFDAKGGEYNESSLDHNLLP